MKFKRPQQSLSAMICLLLCIAMMLCACQNATGNKQLSTESPTETQTPAETEPPAKQETKQKTYSVVVKNASGTLVPNVVLQISKTDSDPLSVTTDANGIASFSLDENDSVLAYRVKITQLPDGYV